MGGDRPSGRDPRRVLAANPPLTPGVILEGPVSICVERQSLSLDRPFTYLLAKELEAGVGSLVKVPFHGRDVRGWVLGPTEDLPTRMLEVTKTVSSVRFFDEAMLGLLRWMSERYVAPLASVVLRSHPPRVVSEERAARSAPPPEVAGRSDAKPLGGYRNGPAFLETLARGGEAAFVHRPAPGEGPSCAAEGVLACLANGRSALVLVPECEPLPATAAAVLEAVGDAGVLFAGGDKRERYRTWLDIAGGRYRCVVGTRPAVFSPVASLGLVWISRESHPGHREERSPHYHVREVALARARTEGATAVISATCPSAEAAVLDAVQVTPATRAWPPVEVVRPGTEGRAPRLLSALRSTRGAFVFEPLRGYGVARVCRACSEPAACASCDGLLRLESGRVSCAVCGAAGRCANCGASDFGIRRGGRERVEEWLSRATALAVRGSATAVEPPRRGEVVVGGPEAVKDFADPRLDLVAILDPDLAASRPGLASAERALGVWMEAASWAGHGGRVIVQSAEPGGAAIQALVAGNPERFHRHELLRREAAGFPAGFPVFRVSGGVGLASEMEGLSPVSLLATSVDDEAIFLVTLRPEQVGAFGRVARSLAEKGLVTRVEAEPHL